MDAVCVTASYPGLLHGVHCFLHSRSENRLHNGPGYKANMSHEMLFNTARNIVMKHNEVYEVRLSPTAAAVNDTTEKIALQDNPGYGVTPANLIELQDNPGYGVIPANPIELQDNPGYGVTPVNPIELQDNPGYGVTPANPIELQAGYGVIPANPIKMQDNPGYGVIPANPIKMQDNPGYGVISANHSQRAEKFAQKPLTGK